MKFLYGIITILAIIAVTSMINTNSAIAQVTDVEPCDVYYYRVGNGEVCPSANGTCTYTICPGDLVVEVVGQR